MIIAALSSVSVVSLSLRTISVAVGDDGIAVVVAAVVSSLYEPNKTALPNTNSVLINLLFLPFLPASLR